MKKKKNNWSDWTFVFDFDGTIANTTMLGINRVRHICEKMDLIPEKTPNRQALREVWGLPYQELVNTLAQKFNWSKKDYENFWEEELNYVSPELEKFTEIEFSLKYLHGNKIKMLILSSREKHSIIHIAPLYGIDLKLFEYIQGGDCHKHTKPDPRVFDPIMDYLQEKGRDLDKLIYIGDTVDFDYMAARRRGIKFVAVASSFISTPNDFISAGLNKEMIFSGPANVCFNFQKIIEFYS